MSTVFCDNCGTSLLDENAKFCRACGKPTPQSEAATPLSEAATKRFDQQRVIESPTRPVASSTTGPAYMAPFELPPTLPPAQPTNDLRQKAQRRNLIIIGSMLAVLIFALVGLLVFLNFGLGPPNGTAVEPPPLTDRPPLSPPPPPPPPAPGIGGPSTIDPSLIYPGVRQTMSINNEGGESVIQLVSEDAATKVAD